MNKPNLLIINELNEDELKKYTKTLLYTGRYFLKKFTNSDLIDVQDIVQNIFLDIMDGKIVVNLDIGNPISFLQIVVKNRIKNELKSKKFSNRVKLIEESVNFDYFITDNVTPSESHEFITLNSEQLSYIDKLKYLIALLKNHFSKDPIVLTLLEAWTEKGFEYGDRFEICDYYNLSFKDYDNGKARLTRIIDKIKNSERI
ncbi:MAG: hypothetical protein O9340_15705 [Cyclobacteriaceae bacterium]|nr:hypothetical protein [Cyclobacteriaceae bacterium]